MMKRDLNSFKINIFKIFKAKLTCKIMKKMIIKIKFIKNFNKKIQIMILILTWKQLKNLVKWQTKETQLIWFILLVLDLKINILKNIKYLLIINLLKQNQELFLLFEFKKIFKNWYTYYFFLYIKFELFNIEIKMTKWLYI